MKILHIQQFYFENWGYQENILPYYHKKLGHDVTLITSTCLDKNNRYQQEREFFENNFKIKRINTIGQFKKRFVLFKDLYKLLEEEKPDYIFHHSVTSPSLKTICNYKKEHREVFIATDNHADFDNSGKNKIWKYFYYNLFWKSFILKYDKYINVYFGVTPIRCLFLEKELGITSEKIRLLPLGVDEDKASVKLSKEEYYKKYNIDKDCFIVVHGGKITKEKQVDRILRAFSRIEDKNIRLILFGTLEDPYVKSLIANDCRIKFIGWLNREDTLSILKYSDVGVWNTQHTTLLEDCIAVDLPMILRYYGNTCHLIDNTGLYLYEGTIREIEDKISFLINNRDIVKVFKENIPYIRKLLSYDNIANESIEYSKNLNYLETHKKFMSLKYFDKNYKYLKRINRN